MLRARRLPRPGGTRAQRRARDETADPDRRLPQLRRASHVPRGSAAYTRRVPHGRNEGLPGGHDLRQRARTSRMALRLKIVGALGQKLGERSTMEFGPSGCDWVRPAPRRYLSGRHASIDFRGGCYYVVDTSTNGVYVNDAEVPVGRGKPQRLFNGDRIRIGDYEIVAEIDDDTIERLIDQNHVEPVPLAQRVEAPAEPTSEMVDAFEMTGVGFEMKLTDDELSTLTALKGRRDDVVIELEDNAPDFARTRPSLASRGVTAPRPKAAERPQPRPAEGHSKPAVERAPAPPQAHKAPLNG